MHAYGFSQITITVGIVRDPLAHARQYLERIKIVDRLQRLEFDL